MTSLRYPVKNWISNLYWFMYLLFKSIVCHCNNSFFNKFKILL